MDKYMIARFAGRYLDKNYTISPTSLNHFIAKDESVGKLIDDKIIVEVLEDFVEDGWLIIEKSDPVNPIYTRYIDEYNKRKLGKEYAAKEKKNK